MDLRRPSAQAACRVPARSAIHLRTGVVKPVFGRASIAGGNRCAQRARSCLFGGEADAIAGQAIKHAYINKRNPYFQSMRHARPIGIAQQLVAHVPTGFQSRDLRMDSSVLQCAAC